MQENKWASGGWAKWLTWGLLALLAALALRLSMWGLSARPTRSAAPASQVETTAAVAFAWPEIPASAWSRLRSQMAPAGKNTAGILSKRFRLAGIFLLLAGQPGNDQRCAILDDLITQKQYLLQENEWGDGIQVTRVDFQSVVLFDGTNEETIYLATGTLPGTASTVAAPVAPIGGILETNRFGNRVGDARWEFSKGELMKYAQEVMDEPERLSAIYISLEPDYNETQKVDGYRLNMVGEQDFWAAAGLQQGDVIRRVNSMKMTSQRRAEYFLGEFMKDNLGAVVLDIERDGQSQKLVYLLR